MPSVTHDELVKRGAQWLIAQGMPVVVTNLVAGGPEHPDVIGWKSAYSIVIEAKTSLSDFKADSNKIFRRYPEEGMGHDRYYIIPNELEEKILPLLPDKWGLLIYGNKRAVVRKKPSYVSFVDHDKNAEIANLVSVIRRIGRNPIEGVAIKAYTIMEPTKTELFIIPEE